METTLPLILKESGRSVKSKLQLLSQDIKEPLRRKVFQ